MPGRRGRRSTCGPPRRRRDAENPTAVERPARQLAARPARRAPAGVLEAAAGPWSGEPSRRLAPDDPAAARALGVRGRACCWPSGSGDPQPGAPSTWRCPAHLSVSQLVALRRDPQRLARALRRPLPEARPVRPPRHRLPPAGWSSGSAAQPAARPRRPARRRPTRTPRPTTPLAELQAALPGQRVGRPGAARGRGAVRHGGRRRGDPGPDGRRVRRRRTGGYDVVDWKTGRQPTGADATRPRCSWPRTGWPGPSWPACRSSRSARPSTTSRDGETVRPADLLDEQALISLITELPLTQ